ncbi:GNAT family N-acetyltransferase [Streptomyces sp. NPDC091268]|uniref:GNAT family N-acetyltransferase n=1 Tax=Streptomyces sp. NPDC091268 TaxID=3365979 RepID=UPI0038236861
MNPTHPTHIAHITRFSENQWHAVQDGREIGRGDTSTRPDGRLFLSIDAWSAPVFDQIASAMVADLPAPLHALVDAGDPDATSGWQRAGFTIGRREREYLIPTDPAVTGLHRAQPPSDITIVPLAQAQHGPLRALDREIRAQVRAAVGWQRMPAEVIPLPPGVTVPDPAAYAVAARADRYVGLLRLAPVPRQPRIGLIAVRAEDHRRGIARALLASVLDHLHHSGTAAARAEVDETNAAAVALFEGISAQQTGSTLELVHR